MHAGTFPQGALRVLAASAVVVSGDGRNHNARNGVRKLKYGFYEKLLSISRRSAHVIYITGNNHCIRTFGLSYVNQSAARIALLGQAIAAV